MRWEPNARGRLEQAALELFALHGYEQTTVDDIATRAGVTKRTFFRHFSDKREVLFAGGDHQFKDLVVACLEAVPRTATPLETVTVAMEGVGVALEHRRDIARRRRLVILANAELQERELIKLATAAAALTEGLRARGVAEPAATVLAETAVAVFRAAFDRWASVPDERDLRAFVREAFDTLRALSAEQ